MFDATHITSTSLSHSHRELWTSYHTAVYPGQATTQISNKSLIQITYPGIWFITRGLISLSLYHYAQMFCQWTVINKFSNQAINYLINTSFYIKIQHSSINIIYWNQITTKRFSSPLYTFPLYNQMTKCNWTLMLRSTFMSLSRLFNYQRGKEEIFSFHVQLRESWIRLVWMGG